MGCANTQLTSGILVSFREYLARRDGTPQPNQKLLSALGVQPGSLDPKPQLLTLGPFLILFFSVFMGCSTCFRHLLFQKEEMELPKLRRGYKLYRPLIQFLTWVCIVSIEQDTPRGIPKDNPTQYKKSKWAFLGYLINVILVTDYTLD